MSFENPSSSNPLYVVFAGLADADLSRWLDAAAQRFAGVDFYPFLISADTYPVAVAKDFSRFKTAADLTQTLRGRNLGQRIFLVLPDRDHEALQVFTNQGFFPTVIEARKHAPEAWAARAALNAA